MRRMAVLARLSCAVSPPALTNETARAPLSQQWGGRLQGVAPLPKIADHDMTFAMFRYGLVSLRRTEMAVKLVLIYPRPKDIEAFETVYNEDTMCPWRSEVLFSSFALRR